jgi:Flp pilus assembly secretin CpaC
MNGETVIIGGLTKDKVDDSTSRIPFLGDIPILGIPFRDRSDSYDKKSLVIMLTPYIVKRSEDLARLKDELSQLSAIERELAMQFNRDLENGKDFEVVDASEEPAMTRDTSVESTREIIIDDYGRTYEIFRDSSGLEINREEIPAGSI